MRADVIKLTHTEWQQQIVELAHTLGWKHLHVRRSIGKGKKWTTATNVKGWPDLWLWHQRHGFVAIEVKVHPDSATPEQVDVLISLRAAGARALVAYPEDFDAVMALLRGRDVVSSALDESTTHGGHD